jgi:ubiquinol-cytochrome c reductase cytochrome b subunit
MPPRIESVVIFVGPVLTVLILLSLPFISHKGERSALRRPWAVFGSICVIVFVFSLFLLGEQSTWSPQFTAKPLSQANIHSQDTLVIHGAALLYQKGCLFCHHVDNTGGLKGPDLTNIARRLSDEDLRVRIVNGGTNMPAYGGILKKEELTAIIAFLNTRK